MNQTLSKLLLRHAKQNCCFLRCFSADKSTVINEEVTKFEKFSKVWWDENGPSKGLHTLNKLRVPLARDGILSTRETSVDIHNEPQPLKGFKILDVGCGAGLYSEALARIGAQVTGIDASDQMISVAKEHAAESKSLKVKPDYVNTTIEDHVKQFKDHYDAVVCSEVIEHVENKPFFVEQCVKCVKSGGSLFYTTINKTWAAWFVMLFFAENIVRVIPKGTHYYDLLMPHRDLENYLTQNGCQLRLIQGMTLLPNYEWKYIKTLNLSYVLHAVKT